MGAILTGLGISRNEFLRLNEARKGLLKLQKAAKGEDEKDNLSDIINALENLDDLFCVTIDSLKNIEEDGQVSVNCLRHFLILLLKTQDL